MNDMDNLKYTIGGAMTKARKKETLKMIAEIVAPRLLELRDGEGRFTFSEIAGFCNLHHARISELVQHKKISEKVVAGLVSGGFVTTHWMLDELKGKIDEGQVGYVRTFSIYELRRLRKMVNYLIEKGDDPEVMMAELIKEKYGEAELLNLDPSFRRSLK